MINLKCLSRCGLSKNVRFILTGAYIYVVSFFLRVRTSCVCVGGGGQFHFAVKRIGTIKIHVLTFIHSFIVAFLNYKICKVNIILYSVEIKEGPKMNDNLFMPLS